MNKLLKIILSTLLLGSVCSSGYRNRGYVSDIPLVLYWTFLNEDTITVEIQWNKKSFIPILLDRKMVGTDLWLCSVEFGQDEYSLSDRWAFDHAPPEQDTDPAHGQGFDNFINPRITMTQNGMICTFTRKLNTGDLKDKVLVKGETYHLCSIDTDSPYLKKHNNDLSNIYCYYWQFIDHFDGQLPSSEQSRNLITLHGIIMTVMWGVFVDVALIAVRYFKTTKNYTNIHSSLLLLINCSVITMALLMIITRSNQIFYNFDILPPGQRMHFIMGITFISCLLAQHIGGVVIKYLQENREIQAEHFLSKVKFHRLGGYFLYFFGKIQLILGWWIYKGYFSFLVLLLLCWYAILLAIRGALQYGYRHRKTFFKKLLRFNKFSRSKGQLLLSGTNLEINELIQMIRQGRSKQYIRKNYPHYKYVHFKNLICDISDFNHPGGASLLQAVNGQDVTKYLHGAAWVQDNPTKKYVHSPYAISYLESKKIVEKDDSTCQIFNQNWELRYITEICPNIFKITLKNPQFSIKTNPKNFQSHIGKFFLVTCTQARPYTLLLCQLDCNVTYRNKILEFYKKKFTGLVQIERQHSSNQVSLLIKRYDQGLVSKDVHFGVKSIQGLFGLGLQIQPGITIIVTGGTGILPFLDLFDILLRKAIFTAAESYQNALDQINIYKLNYSKTLVDCRFKLYASFTTTEEFKHYNWLIDLHLISKKLNLGLFELNLKIPKESELMETNRNFVTHINEQFCNQHFQVGSFSRLYCCGPPEMNTKILAVLKKLRYPQDCYRIM